MLDMVMKKTNYYGIMVILIGAVVLVACLLDSYKNPDTFQKYFHINSTVLLAVFLFISLFLKLKSNYQFPGLITKINSYLVLPISAVVSISLTILGYYTPMNYVFDKTGINYERVAFLALGSLAFHLISLSSTWWVNNYKKATFLSVPVLFLVFFLIRLWHFDFFKNMVLEDHFVENTQFFVVLVSGFISFLIAKNFYHKKNRFLSICYLLFGIGLFFVAGDEISWGQRILGFQTPLDIKVNNPQGEFTVHNLELFIHYTWISYILVSAYGSFGWLLGYIVPKIFRKYTVFVPIPWFASSYFIFSLIYHSLTQPWRLHGIGEWSEVAELMMYFGIFFYCLFIYLNTRNQRLKSALNFPQ